MNTGRNLRARAAVLLSCLCCGSALAQLPTGQASVHLSAVSFITSAIGDHADGGFTHSQPSGSYAVVLLDTGGQLATRSGPLPASDFLFETKAGPDHDYGRAAADIRWDSDFSLGAQSALFQSPGSHDWASSAAEVSGASTLRVAPWTRVTITATLDMAASLEPGVDWSRARYEFSSTLAAAGAAEGQDIHRAGAITAGRDAWNETISFLLENPGEGSLDFVWRQDASVFVGDPVPEPAPVSLALAGAGVLLWHTRRRAGTRH